MGYLNNAFLVRALCDAAVDHIMVLALQVMDQSPFRNKGTCELCDSGHHPLCSQMTPSHLLSAFPFVHRLLTDRIVDRRDPEYDHILRIGSGSHSNFKFARIDRNDDPRP
jgi:hypothetical protein